MERNQPPIAQKSNSFSSSATRDEKLRRRNLSLGAFHFDDQPIIAEGDEAAGSAGSAISGEAAAAEVGHDELTHIDGRIVPLIDDIDQFLAILLSLEEKGGNDNGDDGDDLLPEIPESSIEKFALLVDKEIAKYELGEEKLSAEHGDDEPSVLDAVDRISKLTAALSRHPTRPRYFDVMNLTGSVVHHAMSFLEDEFYSLLDESSKSSKDCASGGLSKTKRPPSFSRISHEQERPAMSPTADPSPADYVPSADALGRLQAIANAMISAGYGIECCQMFTVARRNAFKAGMTDIGFEKIAIDDVQRMPWDQLEGEIAKWTKSFRQLINTGLSLERDLCYSVFAAHREIADDIFYNLASSRTHNLLNFPEAVAMTKRSAEKLFKVLDMYEALKEMIPKVDLLFPLEGKEAAEEKPEEEESAERPEGEEDGGDGPEERPEEESSSFAAALKTEICAAKTRLGEAAVAIFGELENSIKSDVGKNAVPGGAVHPLTRYVINYLKYACEYISTLDQVFRDHRKMDEGSCDDENGQGSDGRARVCGGGGSSHGPDHTPFEARLTQVMDMLQSNLDSKAKLYKELALSNIFLMNNGRYVVQKIKASPEINKLLGNTWCRKRSSDLRQYHKNYQRETWSKVLACFKDDGITVKGSVYKPVLKERFKSFNALFDEIHKVQSTWTVSDEQLQSELRVSISAVIIPAYRSFLGRFSQYLDPGRQTEKYIKFAPEDIETAIDDLFDGNPASSMVKRRA